MPDVTIVLPDGQQFDIPEAVEAAMRGYYTAATKAVDRYNKLTEMLKDVAEKDYVAHKKGATKDVRLTAHYAKKDLWKFCREKL